MTTITDDNIFGFYASFQSGEAEQELVKQYLWGDLGLKEQLKKLKWQTYGQDFHLILFEIYVNPIAQLRTSFKEIGSYRRKEKSIGIPIILDQDNFFGLSESLRIKFFQTIIPSRLELLRDKVVKNKLDLNVQKLIEDSENALQQIDWKAST